MKKVLLALAVLLLLSVSGCKVGAGCALPFAAIGDTLVCPLNGIEWCSDKLIDLGDDHQMKVYEETRNTTYGDLAAYTAWVYYLPGYILWPLGALAPSELYPMTKSCMAVLRDENNTEKKELDSNARYEERKKLDELYRGEEDSFQEW
ncbi:hypothetical protein IKZ70_01025 [bacterium]|jgi:hypothetical protein|nr:hypothetical protein [bacterium]